MDSNLILTVSFVVYSLGIILFGLYSTRLRRKTTEDFILANRELGPWARERGLPVFYGDITRPEILDPLHLERARSIVVAVDSPKAALQLVAMVCYIFPDLDVHARARDDAHADELEKLGAHVVVPELVATGVKLAGSILDAMDEGIAEETW